MHGFKPFRKTDYFAEGSSCILSVLIGKRGCSTAERVVGLPPQKPGFSTRTCPCVICGGKSGRETWFYPRTIKTVIPNTGRYGMFLKTGNGLLIPTILSTGSSFVNMMRTRAKYCSFLLLWAGSQYYEK
jgi:hypothetical protein